jgi:biopolymer transport protein TolR
MTRPRPLRIVHHEISLLPLVDCCLVLVILFVVVLPLTGVPSPPRKPAASTAARMVDTGPKISVLILADGSIDIEGRHVQARELPAVLDEVRSVSPDRPAVVQGDRHVRYRQVLAVLQALNAAGFRRASLVTEPPEPAL